MKILAIGDFHGKFPAKLKKLAKEVDLIVSIGNYPPWSFKKLFFKYCYQTDKHLWEIIGKKKYKECFLKDWATGEKILKKLNSFKCPVVTSVGNYDHHKVNDSIDFRKTNNSWKWAEQDFFSKTIKNYPHIKRIDYQSIEIGNLVLIGAYGGSFPGNIKSRGYRRYRRKLEKLFKKYSKENLEGRVIFITHNVPYNTKIDKILDNNALKIVKGKHYGLKLIRRIIDKYQPILSIGGHMHENQGKGKIGKSLIINTGAAENDKAVIIDFDEKKGKVKKVRFIK